MMPRSESRANVAPHASDSSSGWAKTASTVLGRCRDARAGNRSRFIPNALLAGQMPGALRVCLSLRRDDEVASPVLCPGAGAVTEEAARGAHAAPITVRPTIAPATARRDT